MTERGRREMTNTLLIANRSEIASRIIATAKRMGIRTVAVYSDADAALPYVEEANVARRIGESPPAKSYLNQDALMQIAKEEQCTMLHPGYGFLSENQKFCEKVLGEGIIWVGPQPKTIGQMGEKVQARNIMNRAGVPVVPGSEGQIATEEEAISLAEGIGYPVMLKASGGGGGVGMVVCHSEQDLVRTFASTKKRAEQYFQNPEVFLEKWIEGARHIEVQIAASRSGEVVHLYERECSIQRRHQKVLEEAPALHLSQTTKEKLYEASIQAAKAVNYENVGTIEWIVDQDENFYFLEMNTRLQVEHGVTEQIIGIDLVEWQLRIAAGESLPLHQHEIKPSGHSIEWRLYAEDPKTMFPSPGKLSRWELSIAKGIRLDIGYREDNTVTPFYDPLLAKIIAYGDNKEEAVRLLHEWSNETTIEGVKTNLPLLQEVLVDQQFIKETYTTNYLTELQKQKGEQSI